MKVLWITNIAVNTSKGSWMALYHDELSKCDVDIVIVTSEKRADISSQTNGRTTYYVLPGGSPYHSYKGNNKRNIRLWRELLEREKPDIIEIWGTESQLGVAALTAAPEIPAVVFIQGLMRSLHRFCLTGISAGEMLSSLTLRGIIKGDFLLNRKKRLLRQCRTEEQVINRAGNYIYENKWCDGNCHAIAPGAAGYRLPLPYNNAFGDLRWSYHGDSHRIITPYMYDTFKGFHILLRAIEIVKRSYPDVKLLIPGNYRGRSKGLKSGLALDDYTKLVLNLIDKFGLSDSIEYMGYLTHQQYAERMADADIFVQPSVVENHSSTLKEAMAIGLPCIASDVGGVTDYAVNMHNAVVFRCEDYELLAKYIIMLFRERELCNELSANARKEISQYVDSENIGEKMINIYNRVILSHRK